MKHNINPLIHPNLLNNTFTSKQKINRINAAISTTSSSFPSTTLSSFPSASTSAMQKNTKIVYKKFIYNVCIPVIILIIICFILKDRYKTHSAFTNIAELSGQDLDLELDLDLNHEQIYRNIGK